jgi:transposase
MARRCFSLEFKRKVVEEYVKGGRSAAEVCAQYQLHENLIYRWRKQYEAEAQGEEQSRAVVERQLREAQARIEDLESALGRSAAEVDLLRRAFGRAAP